MNVNDGKHVRKGTYTDDTTTTTTTTSPPTTVTATYIITSYYNTKDNTKTINNIIAIFYFDNEFTSE